MELYPSIPKTIIKGQDYYLFDKLDGSNIRVEFSLKNGFNKFGTRKKLLSDDSGILNLSKNLILKLEKDVYDIFKSNKWLQGTLFFEFYGDKSFAGNHEENDNFKVVLIDAHIYKKGYLAPKEYLKAFDKIPMSEFLGIYHLNQEIINKIKENKFEGVTFEGVIGKAFLKNKHIRTKVKTNDWLNKLKDKCGDDENLFNLLS